MEKRLYGRGDQEETKFKQMSATFGYSRHQTRDFNKQMTTTQDDRLISSPAVLNSQRSSTISTTNSTSSNVSNLADESSLRASPNSSVSFGTTSSSNSSLNNGYNSLNCSITSSTGSYVNCSSSSTTSSVGCCNGGAGVASQLGTVAESFKVLSLSPNSESTLLIDTQQQHQNNQPEIRSIVMNDISENQQQQLHSPTRVPNINYTTSNQNQIQTTLTTSATYSSLQAKPLKCFESRSAYVEAMKEDLAEWLNRLYPDLDLTSGNFFSRLETGSIICRHANYVTNMGRKALTSKLNDSLEAHSSKNRQIITNHNEITNHGIQAIRSEPSQSMSPQNETNDSKQRRKSNVAPQQQQRSKIPRSKSNFFTPSKSYSSLNILINNTYNNQSNCNDNNNNNNNRNNDNQQLPNREARLASPATTTPTSQQALLINNNFVPTTCQNGDLTAVSSAQRPRNQNNYRQQDGGNPLVTTTTTITTTPKNKHHMIDWLKVRVLSFKPDARPGTFFARDNICQFILWCRSLNILDCLLFETDDLVARKNERSFILCMLEVARIGFNVGVPTPLIIQLEQEIDREIENEAKQQQQATINQQQENINEISDNEKRNYVQLHEDDDAEAVDDEAIYEYGPKPQVITNDLMSLHEKVSIE